MSSCQQESPHLERMKELREEAYADLAARQYAAAEEKSRRLLPLQQRLIGTEHEFTLDSRTMHACSLISLGRYSEAEDILRDVLQIRQQSPEFGIEHPSTLISVTQLGHCLLCQGRWKEAEPMLRKVYGMQVRVLGPRNAATLIMQVTLGSCLTEDNQLEEAEGLLRDAWEAYKKMGTDSYSKAMVELVKCLVKGGRAAEAEPVCREAVRVGRHTLGEHDQSTLSAMAVHGDVLETLDRYAEAEVVCKLALQGHRAVYGWTHEHTLEIVHRLAGCMGAQGKAQPMEDLLRETLSRVHQDLGEGHPTTIEWMRHLVRHLQHIGKVNEAKALRRRAKELERTNKAEHHG